MVTVLSHSFGPLHEGLAPAPEGALLLLYFRGLRIWEKRVRISSTVPIVK